MIWIGLPMMVGRVKGRSQAAGQIFNSIAATAGRASYSPLLPTHNF